MPSKISKFLTTLLVVSVFNQTLCNYVNLNLFLAHTRHCYTHLIKYNPNLNFESGEFPVAVSERQHSYPKEDAGCISNPNRRGSLTNHKTGFCKTVLKNFHQKGIVCLAIGLLYSKKSKDVGDACWYIKKYWGTGSWIDKSIRTPTRDFPFLPTKLYFSNVFLFAVVPPAQSVWGKQKIVHNSK